VKLWILGVLGSSSRRSFLTPQSRVLAGFGLGGSERETGGIRSEGISGGGFGGPELDPGIIGFRVHLNSRVLTFCLNVTF